LSEYALIVASVVRDWRRVERTVRRQSRGIGKRLKVGNHRRHDSIG
jgi:hypothetical protein